MCVLFCFKIFMFEPHHQLETKILSSCFTVSTYPGESPQTLTRGDENHLSRPPYLTSMLFQNPRWFNPWIRTVVTATGHPCQSLVLDGWMFVFCRVNSHLGLQVTYSGFAHLLGCYPQGPAQAPARCLASSSFASQALTPGLRPLVRTWVPVPDFP